MASKLEKEAAYEKEMAKRRMAKFQTGADIEQHAAEYDERRRERDLEIEAKRRRAREGWSANNKLASNKIRERVMAEDQQKKEAAKQAHEDMLDRMRKRKEGVVKSPRPPGEGEGRRHGGLASPRPHKASVPGGDSPVRSPSPSKLSDDEVEKMREVGARHEEAAAAAAAAASQLPTHVPSTLLPQERYNSQKKRSTELLRMRAKKRALHAKEQHDLEQVAKAHPAIPEEQGPIEDRFESLHASQVICGWVGRKKGGRRGEGGCISPAHHDHPRRAHTRVTTPPPQRDLYQSEIYECERALKKDTQVVLDEARLLEEKRLHALYNGAIQAKLELLGGLPAAEADRAGPAVEIEVGFALPNN